MYQMSHEPVLGSHRIEPRTDVHATCVLHLPTPMLRDVERTAARLDRDLSYCLRMAWSIGCAELGTPELGEMARASRMMAGRKRPVVVSLPLSTWLHVTTEAEQLDRSRSWVMQRVWLAARARLVNAMR
jgi:hypothetical protein